jgi:hypothetical protein
VLLRAKGKRVNINAGVRGAGMVLPRLDLVKVGALTLREAILAVKLELSGDDGVHTPAVKGERSLGKNESAGIRYTRVLKEGRLANTRGHIGLIIALARLELSLTLLPPVSIGDVDSAGLIKETRTIDE